MTHLSKCALLALVAVAAVAQTPPGEKTARKPGLYATIDTSMGPLVIRLYEKETPLTVKNFVDLAMGRKAFRDPKTRQVVKRPLYNGTTFHRVIPQFMVQAGDPAGTGAGQIGFTIKDEIRPGMKFDQPGRVAMANIGSPNTSSCQFFITEVPYPSLNGGYTIFGQLVDGLDLVRKMARVPRNAEDKPRTPIVIKTITFERVGPAPTPDVLAGPAPAAPAK